MLKNIQKYLIPVVNIVAFFAISGFNCALGQVTLNPSFPTKNSTITVTYDANQGNKALLGQTTVYMHTGVITNLSSSGSDWKYVQGAWGTDDAKVKMTSLGNNLFSLTYNISSFYNIPANEQVLKLAFVFRNQSGSIVGRDANGGDIFMAISDGSFQASFTGNKSLLLMLTDTIKIKAKSSASAQFKLYRNGTVISQIASDSNLSFNDPCLALGYGKYKYVLEATANNQTKYDTLYALVHAAPNISFPPSGTEDGITYLSDTSVMLQIYAPAKNFIYVVGDFTNWEYDPAYQMNRTPDASRYWLKITGLKKMQEYGFQYYIDKEQLKVADVYADKLLDPWNDGSIPAITYPNLKPYPQGKTSEVVSVLQTGQTPFNWQNTAGFNRPAKEKLFIYELHLRDFIGRHDFQTLKDTLSYLKRLGVNAIELMPVTEFEGNESWGYNISFYFAVDKYYGTKDAYKQFIDECHKMGIAVIMDIVLNHSFGQNPQVRMYFNPAAGQYGQPTPNNPWFNEVDKHPYGVGYDYNHESSATQNFVDDVLRYWITEYKIDGYRFDLSKGFTQKNTLGDVGAWSSYDASRIDLLKRMYNQVRTYDSSCYLVLEHLSDNSEEKVLAAYGFMLWGNMNYNFTEASMGFVSTSNLNGSDYKNRGWASANLVAYGESHDEERMMFKNLQYGNSSGSYTVKDLNTALKRNEAALTFLLLLKGPKMIWQFGELGYDISIDQNGRTGNKPILWNYKNNGNRYHLYQTIRSLNQLKQTEPAFSSDNYIYNTSGAVKTLTINDPSLKCVAIGNFNVTATSAIPGFHETGWWYDYLTNDSIEVTNITAQMNLLPGEYHVYLNKRKTNIILTDQPAKLLVENISLQCFPVPTHGELVYLKNTTAQDMPSINVRIMSSAGQLVYENKTLQIKSQEVIELPLKNLASGIYFLQIQAPDFTYQTRLITQ